VSLHPLLLLTVAARQQRQRGTRMINNDWQAMKVGLLDTREIARIVVSNTTRIDLPIMATIGALTYTFVYYVWQQMLDM